MKTISEEIRDIIAAAKPKLLKISPEIAGKKLNPDTWSKKEILGHLIDSASNNHQRFVRGAQDVARKSRNPFVKISPLPRTQIK